MRNKAFTLLVCGILSPALLPPASIAAELSPTAQAADHWQAQPFAMLQQGPLHLADPSWRQVGQNPGHRPYKPLPRYRFRPWDNQQPSQTPARRTYRPVQFDIPNHYVYRPLNPVKYKQPRVRHWAWSAPPQSYGYLPPEPARYRPYPYPPQRMAPPPPASRYVYGGRLRPAPIHYPAHPMGPNIGAPAAWSAPMPRYTRNMDFNRPRFRPQAQPRPVGYRLSNQGRSGIARYSYPVRSGHPAMAYQWRYPERGHLSTHPRPHIPQPVMGIATRRAATPNRYGVDWYDGRSDGDGAWYKLAEQKAWPQVSQHWPAE